MERFREVEFPGIARILESKHLQEPGCGPQKGDLAPVHVVCKVEQVAAAEAER